MICVYLASNPLRGQFQRAGFQMDKNFIELPSEKFLLEVCIDREVSTKHQTVCIVPRDQLSKPEQTELESRLRERGSQVSFIGAPPTHSSISSLLWASDYLGKEPVMVLPGDAILSNLGNLTPKSGVECQVLTTVGFEERWGFVETDPSGNMVNFASKTAISNRIATGAFLFQDGSTLMGSAEEALLAAETKDSPAHLGDVAQLLSGFGRVEAVEVPAESFIPLASPGDVRRYLDRETI